LEGNEIGDAGATALSKGIAVSFVFFCVFSFLVWATPSPVAHLFYVMFLLRRTKRSKDLIWTLTRSVIQVQQP
jgi:hypothetical protein